MCLVISSMSVCRELLRTVFLTSIFTASVSTSGNIITKHNLGKGSLCDLGSVAAFFKIVGIIWCQVGVFQSCINKLD